MENNNKPLTLEDILNLYASHFLNVDNVSKNLLLTAVENFAYHQTLSLREELEAALQDHMDACLAIVDIKSELEAVKKERDGLLQIADQLRKDYERMERYGNKITDQLSEVTRQRDEAVKNTVELCRKAFAAGMDLEESGGRGEDWKGFYNRELSRLSSGETKPEFKCIHGLPDEATCIDCLDDAHRPPPESLTDKTK